MMEQANITTFARFVDQLDTCLQQLLGFGLDALHPTVAEGLIGHMAQPDAATVATWRHLTARADGILAEHGEPAAKAVEILRTSAGMVLVLKVTQHVFAEMAGNVIEDHRAALIAAMHRQREALDEIGQQVADQIEPEPCFTVIEGGRK